MNGEMKVSEGSTRGGSEPYKHVMMPFTPPAFRIDDQSDFQKGREMEVGQVLNREAFVYFLDLEVKRARRYQNFFCLITLSILGSVKKEKI